MLDGDISKALTREMKKQKVKIFTSAKVEKIDGGEGWNQVMGTTGDDRLDFSRADAPALENIDRIQGGRGDDTLINDDTGRELYGDAGNDMLHGGRDGDRLYGGAGNDGLHGLGGDDTLIASTVTAADGSYEFNVELLQFGIT